MRALITLWLILTTASVAHAQHYLLPDNKDFTAIVEAIIQDDLDTASKRMDSLPAEAQQHPDYMYLQTVLITDEINNVGMFRAARLARQMRRILHEAIELDPDHDFSHFALALFYGFAPGIVGGDKEKQDLHIARLAELTSPLRFPAQQSKLQASEDIQQELALLSEWTTEHPELFDAHFTFTIRAIALEDYALAAQSIENGWHSTNEDNYPLLRYQSVRLAAISNGEVSSVFREQAIAKGEQLLGIEHDEVDVAWLRLRLAQASLKANQVQRARVHLDDLEEYHALDEKRDNAHFQETLAKVRRELRARG